MIDDRAQQRMTRPNDARALRSRKALQRALLALLEERPFHEITIRDVTNRAEVSYPTFFRRYAAKEDLLEDLASAEVRQMLSSTAASLDSADPETSLTGMCAYVREHRALWKSLLTTQASRVMREEFARISAELGNNAGLNRKNPWLPVSLASQFVASGIFEILAWWLGQDEDYPTGNIVKFLMHLIVGPTFVAHRVEVE